ncbi:hypothetical protein Clacol_000916 [Clathrus columnatus]|uniref:LysM domain-containing protein n=1 Tax=Clathrus columnatus TaxID=1419009 RepID=A0AAV4ZY26_9AGAM|nr:hypothetical protein Clacol_000916 [Clathrus columnatus]
MHRPSTYLSGVEKEEKKKAGTRTSPSGFSLLISDGDGFGKNKGERSVSLSDYRYGSEDGNGIGEGFDDDNPWVNSRTVSTATLRSRRQYQRKESGREIGYVYDDEDTATHSNVHLHEHRPLSETRRRRRSRSAIGSISKHPLYVDTSADAEGDGNVNLDGHSSRNRLYSSSKSPFISSYSREGSSSSTPGLADHQTRPSLRRAIGSWEGRKDVETDRSSKGSGASDNDVDVVVHKVMRTDTLAGISLKYNIPLAQLRKANKLWTNDSIHLRNVLYIPLRDVSLPSRLSPNILLNNPDSASISKSSTHTNLPETALTPSTQGEIHKVPILQLSFFPPSGGLNTPTSIPSTRPRTNTQQRTTPNLTPPTRSIAFGGSSPSFSLAFLIQGLNNASQEIKSRLSFDSKHSSETGEEGGEIEMDPVKNRSGKRSGENRGYHSGRLLAVSVVVSVAVYAPFFSFKNDAETGAEL